MHAHTFVSRYSLPNVGSITNYVMHVSCAIRHQKKEEKKKKVFIITGTRDAYRNILPQHTLICASGT